MTKFQLISDLLNITNGLLQTGVNGCSINETRTSVNTLFDDFEENEDIYHHAPHTVGDLELYFQLVANLHEEGYNLWLDKKMQEGTSVTTLQTILDEMAHPNAQQEVKLMQATMMYKCLDHIETMGKQMPPELKQYLHTIQHLHEDSYIMFLDESEGDFISEPGCEGEVDFNGTV